MGYVSRSEDAEIGEYGSDEETSKNGTASEALQCSQY